VIVFDALVQPRAWSSNLGVAAGRRHGAAHPVPATADVRDAPAAVEAMTAGKRTSIFHLAAQVAVTTSFDRSADRTSR
jgi:nucleoside-diphosphate-sugar epimerase